MLNVESGVSPEESEVCSRPAEDPRRGLRGPAAASWALFECLSSKCLCSVALCKAEVCLLVKERHHEQGRCSGGISHRRGC